MSALQRQIYNLIERISITMEVEEEVRTFINTFLRLDEVTFRKRTEDMFGLIKNFNPDHPFVQVLRTRLKIRKTYEGILERPFDYSDEEVHKMLSEVWPLLELDDKNYFVSTAVVS